MYARLNVILVTWLPVAGILAAAASYLTIWAAILHIKRVRRLAHGKYRRICCRLMVNLHRRMGLSGAVFIQSFFLGGVGRGHPQIHLRTELMTIWSEVFEVSFPLVMNDCSRL